MKTIRTIIAVIGIIGYATLVPVHNVVAQTASSAITTCPAGIPYTPPTTPDQSKVLTAVEQNLKIMRSMVKDVSVTQNGIRATITHLGYCGYDEATATPKTDVIMLSTTSASAYLRYGESPTNLNQQTQAVSLISSQLPRTIDATIPGLKQGTQYYVDLMIYVQGRVASATGGNPLSFVTPTISGGGVAGSENPDQPIGGSENPGEDITKLQNPLGKSIGTLPDFVKELVDIFMVIGVPVVALMIIYSGFMLVTARGNEKKLQEGKKAFYAAVVGGAILLGAYVIAEAIGGTINQIRG